MMEAADSNFFIDLSVLLFYAYYVLLIRIYLQQTEIYSKGRYFNLFTGLRGVMRVRKC